MHAQLTPRETLIIWRLLFEPDGIWLSELKPELKALDRKSLESKDLINVEKRKKGGKGRAVMFVKLEDEGWAWAAANLDAELPVGASNYILRQAMICIKARTSELGISLAAFVSQTRPRAETKEAPQFNSTRDDVLIRILVACQSIKDEGAYGGRVRLADLRRSLSDVPRDTFDQGLVQLEKDKRVAVYPLDNPQEIEPDDVAASIPNSIGQPRHILYVSPTG